MMYNANSPLIPSPGRAQDSLRRASQVLDTHPLKHLRMIRNIRLGLVGMISDLDYLDHAGKEPARDTG